ncbi:MAG TPA: hypothetical protein VII02_04475 [Gemmatimonadaceae bacterium]
MNRMIAKNFLPFVVAATLWSCSETAAPSSAEVDLTLTQVDGKPLPFTVGVLTAGATATVVTSGTLVGNNTGPDCNITLTLASGDPIVVPILPCTINKGDVIDYPIDMGNSTGFHLYRFQ